MSQHGVLSIHLLEIVARRVAAPRVWLAEVAASSDVVVLETAFVEASRRLGAAALTLDAGERGALSALGLDWRLDTWGVDDAARAAWLLRVAEDAPAGLEAFVERRRRRGDARQRAAILKALPLLPDAQGWLAVALEARRGDIRSVLAALACDNPYPATHFHEVHFDELVVTALEADLPLARIVGLAERVTDGLAAAAHRFAAARRASGRGVPADLGRLTGEVWSPA
jgi:hypothetical protein